MKEIYILSGLGADEQVYKNIDFSLYSITHIQWIVPPGNITIESYAKLLSEEITAKEPILIGLSFGGIMAIEIAKWKRVEKIILISSAKTKHEIPFYYRWIGKLGLHKVIPASLLKSSNFLTFWFFGVKSLANKRVLKDILHKTNPVYLSWAIDKIVHWKNEDIPANTFHIHGTTDKILPIKYIDCDYKIEGGEHLMVLDKTEELNVIFKTLLV